MSPRNKWYKCSYIVCCIYCIFCKLVSLLFTLLIFFVDTFFSWLYTLWVFFRQLFAIWLIFDTRKCPQKKIILKRIILFLNQRRDVGIPSFPQDSIDHLFSVFFSKTTNVNYDTYTLLCYAYGLWFIPRLYKNMSCSNTRQML